MQEHLNSSGKKKKRKSEAELLLLWFYKLSDVFATKYRISCCITVESNISLGGSERGSKISLRGLHVVSETVKFKTKQSHHPKEVSTMKIRSINFNLLLLP